MRGVLLFAFNNGVTDYFQMAIATAKRAKRYLNLPTTVITDRSTDLSVYKHEFDNIIVQDADTTNKGIENQVWINKGRYRAFELSPYDETLLLDTDYLINSDTLLRVFDIYEDFMCHRSTSFLLEPELKQEIISKYSFNTLWATVIAFKKTEKTRQLFDCLRMVQDNYSHYSRIYNFHDGMYRNDYGLTIALHIVNGNTEDERNYIPWNLVHLDKHFNAEKLGDTEYKITNDKQYIILKNTDFHLMNKETFMELVSE